MATYVYYADTNGDRTIEDPYCVCRRTTYTDMQSFLRFDLAWHFDRGRAFKNAFAEDWDMYEITEEQAMAIIDRWKRESIQKG